MLKLNYMSKTSQQVKHLMKTNVFNIAEKVKSFQKPKRDNRFKNKRVRG
jgi:hypothetical protein